MFMQDLDKTIKIQKLLSQRGVASRRNSERMIEQGRVFVGDEKAHIAMRVPLDASVTIDGKLIEHSEELTRLMMINKPEGFECSRKPKDGLRSVFELLPKIKKGRWILVGRLDVNTSGLLLFTNDGDLAHRLMHPSFHITRGYLVRCRGRLDELQRKKVLSEGIYLDDKLIKFSDLQLIHNKDGHSQNNWYRCSLNVGYYHVVRRSFEALGLEVNRLKRYAFGPVGIPKTLRLGKCMEIDAAIFEGR